MAEPKPGEVIENCKYRLMNDMVMIVKGFEDVTGVQVQSVHCYAPEPDPKLLKDAPKLKVDIILKL